VIEPSLPPRARPSRGEAARRWIVAVLAAALLAGLSGHARAATTTIKIGTLLPQNSPWGKALKKWAGLVASDTNDDLQIDFQWNGQAGDEALMVQKIRVGQLDGAIVSATGLAQTGVTDALIFQLPGLFRDSTQLDTVRAAVADELNKQFEARGFIVLGWGDAGPVRSMSIGYEVHHPRDLVGKGVFVVNGDPVGPVLFSAIGGITPRSLPVTEILPGLTNGSITFLVAPAILVEQLQWASRITHVGADTSAFAVGGFLASAARMQALPQRFKDIMAARGASLQSHLDPLVRGLDDQAFARMKATKTVYALSDAEKSEWKDVFARVSTQLRGSVFTPAFYDRVMELARH
jgi:TRAP-type C4-dicarboxylate transport system substrate-binding protein